MFMAHYSGAPSAGFGFGLGIGDPGWTRIDCFSVLADLISVLEESCFAGAIYSV